MLRYMGYACAGLTGVALAVNVLLGIVVYWRMGLPYGDDGLYLDEATLLVYQESTILVLVVVIGLVTLFMIGAFWFGRKLMKIWVTEES